MPESSATLTTPTPLHAAFITAAQLANQARLMRDEAIAVNANRSLADHILRHARALEDLRDELHDLALTPEDLRQGALPRRTRD